MQLFYKVLLALHAVTSVSIYLMHIFKDLLKAKEHATGTSGGYYIGLDDYSNNT